ncbi:MAG TPA: energy transducer TonB [Burkholderiales bacterium]|nr:energy transducer TonB [Burkholderiales bacterium]
MRPIEPSPTDAAKPARKAANKRLSKTARELGGADERDAAGMPRLTEAEAKEALDQELSLKVGKQMRSDDYPDEARRQRWTGTALVEVLIAADGLIKRVELARTSGFPILDERALDVVRRVPKLFVPIRLRGGEQRAQVPIGFYLQD